MIESPCLDKVPVLSVLTLSFKVNVGGLGKL
jgi:hypothetical protein